MCHTSCRIVLFAHSQRLPLANLCRLSGVKDSKEGCARNKANRLMCSGNHRPKITQLVITGRSQLADKATHPNNIKHIGHARCVD